MKNRILSALCTIPLMISCTDIVYEKSNKYNKFQRSVQESINYPSQSRQSKYERIIKKVTEAKKERKEILKEEHRKYIENLREQQRIEEEKKRVEEQKKKQIQSRGLSGEFKEVTCYITYYTNIDNKLQGGHYDKRGKLLTSHNQPICALPSSVSYGSYLVLDEKVNGSNIFKNVDTGNAIKFLDGDKVKVDIFIPNVSEQWIINNLENKVVKGRIYYNN